MSRETQDVEAAAVRSLLPPRQDDRPERAEVLLARLTALEAAYRELLERLGRYERERAEVRGRLRRMLARIGTADAP
jgi:hypothetical protein